MRMRADGEIDALVALGDFGGLHRLLDPRADRDHPFDPGGARPLDDGVEFAGEVREIEMAMTVDERHCAAASGST